MNDYADLGIFFILGILLAGAFTLWVRYTDTHPKRK